jgi:hypothetical protein
MTGRGELRVVMLEVAEAARARAAAMDEYNGRTAAGFEVMQRQAAGDFRENPLGRLQGGRRAA